jgi:hypothetical protein
LHCRFVRRFFVGFVNAEQWGGVRVGPVGVARPVEAERLVDEASPGGTIEAEFTGEPETSPFVGGVWSDDVVRRQLSAGTITVVAAGGSEHWFDC